MSKNILIVESPFQVICAVEAIKYYELGDDFQLVTRLTGTSADRQLISTVKFYNIDEARVHYIRVSLKKGFLDAIKITYWLVFFSFKKIDTIFVGNYDSKFINFILRGVNEHKKILLDDGIKTLTWVANKKYIDYVWFSCFNIEGHGLLKVDKNGFKYLKGLVEERCDSEFDFFIGSPIVEVGLLNLSVYISVIKSVIKNNGCRRLIYIAHRRESEEKIEELRPFIDVLCLDYPIELFCAKNSKPKKFYSLYSTALITLKLLYDVKCIAIRPNELYFDSVDAVYKQLALYVDVDKPS
jgi:hypothetical protein